MDEHPDTTAGAHAEPVSVPQLRAIFDQLGYPQSDTLADSLGRVAVDGGTITGTNVQGTYEAIIDLAKQNVADAFDIFPSSDVVVIAGRGHETHQVIGDDEVEFSDQQVAAEAHAARA